MPFKVGDMVHPHPAWRDRMKLPSGAVKEVLPWGRIDGLVVGDDPTPYIASVFEADGGPTPHVNLLAPLKSLPK